MGSCVDLHYKPTIESNIYFPSCEKMCTNTAQCCRGWPSFLCSFCCTSLWKYHCCSMTSCTFASPPYWPRVLSSRRSAQLPVRRKKWLHHWQDPKEKLSSMPRTEVSPGRDEPGRWGVTPPHYRQVLPRHVSRMWHLSQPRSAFKKW